MVSLPEMALEKGTATAPRGGSGAQAVASAFSQMGRALDAAGDTFQRQAEEEAADRGQAAVTRDPDGNLTVQLKSPMGSSTAAYNRAAKAAYLARLSGDVRQNIHQLSLDANGDVAAFDTAFKAYAQTLTQQVKGAVGKDLTGPVATMLDQAGSSVRLGIVDQNHKRGLAEFEATIREQIDVLDGEMAGLARQGGVGTPEYEARREDVRALFTELAENPQFKMSPERADLLLKRMGDRHTAEYLVGQVEKEYETKGLQAANDMADKAFNDPGLALDAGERRSYAAMAKSRISAINSERRAERTVVQQEASILRDTIRNGGTYDDDEVDQTAAKLAALGDVRNAGKLLRTRAQTKQLSAFKSMSDGEQADLLRQIKDPEVARWSPDRHGLEFYKPEELMGRKGEKNAWIHSSTAAAADALGKAFYDLTGKKVGVNADVPGTPGRRRGTRVASDNPGADGSQHLHGRALDFQISGLSDDEKAQFLSMALKAGFTGVGFYKDSQGGHLHLDTGRPRWWGGKGEAWQPEWAKPIMASQFDRSARPLDGDIDPVVLKEIRKEVASDTKRLIGDIKVGAAKGLAPGQEDMTQIKTSVALLGDADLTAEVSALTADLAVLEQFSDLAPNAQQAALDVARQRQSEEGRDMAGIDVVAAMEAVHNDTVTKLKSDPIGLAVERGLTPAPQPVDFSASDVGVRLAERERLSRRIGAHYGREVPVLRPDEVAGLSTALKGASPGQQAAIFGQMASSLSPRAYKRAVADLAKKSDERLTAAAGALYAERPDVAESVLRGQALLKENPNLLFKDDDANKRSADANLPVTAFGPGMAGARADVMNAVKARYADLSAQANDTTRLFISDRFEQAVNDVTGGLLDFNGEKIIAPVAGMTQEDMDQALKLVDPSRMGNAVTVAGTKVKWADVMRHGKLRAVGSGRYYVQVGSGETAGYLLSERGGPFVLSLSDLLRGEAE